MQHSSYSSFQLCPEHLVEMPAEQEEESFRRLYTRLQVRKHSRIFGATSRFGMHSQPAVYTYNPTSFSVAVKLIYHQHAGIAPRNQQTKYIVLDHVERIADSDLLATLLRAKDITGQQLFLLL